MHLKKILAPKRIAYFLAAICFVLLPFQFGVDVATGEILAGIAFYIVFPLFVLGLLTPRSDSYRFLPQVFGIAFIVIHILVCVSRE